MKLDLIISITYCSHHRCARHFLANVFKMLPVVFMSYPYISRCAPCASFDHLDICDSHVVLRRSDSSLMAFSLRIRLTKE